MKIAYRGVALALLLPSLALAGAPQELPEGSAPPPSIHQIEHDAHARDVIPSEVPGPFRVWATNPVVTKDVFGWLPYWQWSSLGAMQWDLLTHAAYFGVDATSTGALSSLHSWDTRGATFVSTCHAAGVRALLSVELFSSGSIDTLLGNPAYRQNLITNLIDQLTPYGADGIAVDFEGMPVAQKASFVQFLKDLKAQLHAQVPQGNVWIASPAVDWSGAFDYDQIMDNIDGVFVMAYDYHWSSSSQAGPVSPLTSGSIWTSRDVMWTISDYKTYGIARALRKVSLGFPYYGFDYPTTSLSVPSSTTGSGSVVFVKNDPTAGGQWDANSQTPYLLKSGPRQVWCDDATSIALKYDAVNSERMGGTGMWALGYDDGVSGYWDALRQKLVRTSFTGLKVGIDAGHGGSDAGATGPTGLAEKDVALQIALDLQTILQAAGATVVMTRATDVDMTGPERVAVMNSAQVDRAFSIHLGNAASPSTNEVYARVYGSDLVGTLSDSRSVDWAAFTANRLAAFEGIGKGASNVGVAGVRAIDDDLVRDTEMTSILTHSSDITSPLEEARLRDPAYLCGVAYELYRGLADSFGIAPMPKACPSGPQSRPVALAGPGAGAANPPRARAFELATGSTPVLDIVAYGATGYGAKAAGSDTDADGEGEILTGPGPGAVYGPQVRGFDRTGAPIAKINFYAYGTLRYGVNVNAGDVDGNGKDAILTGAGPGKVFGPHVRGFRRAGSIQPIGNLSFFAYQTLQYGARVATGQLDADGRSEMGTAPGPGAVFVPQVRGFDYGAGGVTPMSKVNFFAFSVGSYGAKLCVAPLDGDAYDEIAAGRGESPSLQADVKGWNYDGSAIVEMPGISWNALPGTFGANVAGTDIDKDGKAEVVVGGGPDAASTSRIRAFDVDAGSPVPVAGFDFSSFTGLDYGAEVGGADLGQ